MELGGTNLRQLRDREGLCSPGILEPVHRIRRPFWKAIRACLLAIGDSNISTSELFRPNDLLNAPPKNFLDKGTQALTKCLSELYGKKVGATIKKPQCLRLPYAKCLKEMGATHETFLENIEIWEAIGYKSDLGNFAHVFHGKVKQRVCDEKRQFLGN